MTENIEIDFLKEENLKECYDLCELCFHENGNINDVKKIYNEFKNNEYYKFIVAKKNSKIVGYTSMIILHNLFDGRPVATLWYVCTHPDYRKQGIGTLILNEVEKIAKNYNCEMVYFTSGVENINAHKFYNLNGYKDNIDKAFVKNLD